MDKNLIEILDKNKIDIKNLNSEDVKTLLEHYIKGEFEKEVFTNFLRESNTSFQTFVNGLGSFLDKTSYSSRKYTDMLDELVKELTEQAKNAKTREDEDRIWLKIERILALAKEEAEAGRKSFKTAATIIGGALLIVGGGAVAIATKNTELLKKGAEVIAKESVKFTFFVIYNCSNYIKYNSYYRK